MVETETQLKLLIDILDKKADELSVILSITENQETLLGQPPGSERSSIFNQMTAEKQKHIDEVLSCDAAFQSIFDGIKDKIENNQPEYREYLRTLQKKIEPVLDTDVKIRAQESKNRDFLQAQLPQAPEDGAVIQKPPAAQTPDALKKRLLNQYKRYNIN